MSRIRRYGIFCLCTMIFVMGTSGCVKRTKVVTKPREDQALVGNRGYLAGTPPPAGRKADSNRTYYETEVEIPTIEMNIKLPQWRREWVDKDLSGNRGYLVGGPYQKSMAQAAPVSPPPARRPSFFQPRPQPTVEEESSVEETTYDTYTVQKGETLGEISAKVYGTSRRWKQIFEANQDVLKDPNRLKVGQRLRIPKGGAPSKPSKSQTIK